MKIRRTALTHISPLWVLICFGFFSILFSCRSREETLKQRITFFQYLDSMGIDSLTLHFNLDSVLVLKDEEGYVTGEIFIDTEYIPAEISARGVTRKEYCSFPPLRLKINKKEAKKHWSKPFKYKLVTHCLPGNAGIDYLYREYLTYRLYNLYSDYSFKVHLLKIKYNLGDSVVKNPAFLIEEDEEMANRLGGSVLKTDQPVKVIHQKQYQTMVLFQYMIGNTDWNLSRRHNIRLWSNASSSTVPVPYDFDFSGFVNTTYAKPYPSFPIDNVRQRYWQYRGQRDDDFDEVRASFISKKGTAISMIKDFELLPEDSRMDLIDYLESFYEIIEDKDWKDHLSVKR